MTEKSRMRTSSDDRLRGKNGIVGRRRNEPNSMSRGRNGKLREKSVTGFAGERKIGFVGREKLMVTCEGKRLEFEICPLRHLENDTEAGTKALPVALQLLELLGAILVPDLLDVVRRQAPVLVPLLAKDGLFLLLLVLATVSAALPLATGHVRDLTRHPHPLPLEMELILPKAGEDHLPLVAGLAATAVLFRVIQRCL